MDLSDVFSAIKAALKTAPDNDYTAELHLQVIKYADLLTDLPGSAFCRGVGIPPSYGTEFNKMRKISQRLYKAGLNPSKI